MGHKNMKSKKRKQAVDSGPTSEMTKVKDEPISPNDVICLSDNSSSNDSSDDSTDSSDSSDSTDDDTDSRDSEDLKVVVSDGKTQFSVKFSKKMSMKEFKRMYVVIRRIVRRNKIPSSINVINFHLKKGKKVIRKEKKKQHKIRKKDFTKTANKCNLADKTEPKIEPKTECAEEIENQANPSVWVNPPNSQPEKLNSGHTLQLSTLKDKIISSDRNIESFLIENVDANRIKIAINNPDSFRRYEDLNNADLDYIEETMDLNLQLATELASKNPGENTECLSNLSIQNTSQPPLKIIHNTSFEQEIKYEPELNISEDDEEFRPTKNVSNVPLKQKVKDEPLEVQSKVADSGIADRMSNTVLTDLEQVMIKNEPVKEEPVSSKDDVITLSDDEEDHKKPIIEISCNKKIETEKTEENSEKALHDCNNISKDTELSDSSDDDLKYHERLRNQLMKEISMLSENEDTADEHFENDYPTSSKKRNRKEIFSSSDNSDYARINSAGKKKRRTKIARNKSDDDNETTDEEATFGDLLGNQSNESNADSRKVRAKKNKYSNQRESHARPKSRQEIRPLNEKDLQDEKKSHCNRRSHDGTKAFDEESSSVKKRRSDEKLADKKKSSYEKMPGEKSEVEKSFEEEKLKEEISDRLNKSEQNVKIHKNNANRRHSSEAKSTRISENYNNNSNENSSCAKTAVDPRSMLCGNPVVLLAKVDDQIKVSSPSESVIRAKDKNNINIITKSSTKQESQTASTRNINSQDNKREVPTPESKYSVSKSTTKLNSDFTLKSKLETQNDLDINKSFTKKEAQAASTRSIDSLDNKRKVLSPGPEYSASTSTKKVNRDLTLRSKLETQNDLGMNKSFTKEETQAASTRSIDSLDNKRKVLSPEPEYSASTSTKKLNKDLTLRSKLETQNDLGINKSFIKEETQAASTRSIDSLDNKRKVFSPEMEYSTSKSAKKLKRDLTLRSETDTKRGPEKNQQRHKSTDSVSIDKLNASKIEQYEERTFNEATMKILFEQSQQKVEEIKTLAINSGVTIVKLQMTMEARGHLVNEEPDKLAKQSVEFKQTSLVNKTFDKHETANEFSEESGKSVKLAKEMAMKQKTSLADCDKSANVKTENRRSVELNSEKSFIEKLPSVNSNDFSKINAEMYKSPNVATEIFPKSERTNAESVAKIFPETTNFPYDVERKPVKSFVGRIPKKTVCQSNISPMEIASNDKRNFAHSSNKNSNTYEGKSPIENNAQSKLILSKVIQMVKEAKVQNMQNIPPLMPESPVKKPRPSIDEFLNRVLQLNPVCFKEIDESIIRKVFGEDYIGIRQSYESYLDYYRDTETLLILKLLESMTDPRSKVSHFRCSIVEGSMRSKKKSRMITLKLEVRMSKRDSQTKRYPRKGDLITLTYTSREENKRFVENEVFAFIERVQDQDISERTFCNKNTQYKLRSYIVRTKYIDDHQIGFGTMTTIRKSHNKMQDFAGLKNLLYSPLLNNIIHPKVEDYQLLVVNSENDLLNTGDVLNAQQKDAIIRITETAIRRDPKICLIQGSPATGKTTVVINLVSQLINRSSKLDKESRFRILVCTHSNSAADEIAVRLLEERQKTLKAERLRMLRVGHYNNIDQRVRDITLEDLTKKELNRFINAAMSYDDKKIRESIEFHRMQYNKLKKQIKHAKWYGTRNQIARKIQDYEARLEFLENRQLDIKNSPLHKALSRAVETTVLEGAQVIVCTVTTSFKNYMESVFLGDENGFSVCIIDDSTKSSEIATLLPLSLGVKTLVLVGDTIQQPYSESIIPGQRNKLDGLEQSLFARLWQAFDGHPENPIIQFQTQYRMAYPIIYWPHQYFYKGDFHSPANVRTLNLHCYKVMDLPFIQNDDEAINDDEGKFVARLIRILMNRAGLDTSEKVRIGVITPYHSQKMLLNEEIKRVLDTQPIEVKEKIIVDLNTIDGIQGQERDVIIMSCTLSKGTGLLSDKQKLCLALTRAKSCMILCGNFEKYKRDKMWGHLIKDAETRKFYVEVKQDASDDDITKCIVRVPQHRIPDDVSTLR